MTTQQFLIAATIALLVLFAALGIESYRECQEKGGHFCQLGPAIVK